MLLCAVAILYSPVIFLGRSLQAPLYYHLGPVENGPYGYSGRRPVNVFDVDLGTPAYYEWPINLLVGRAYRHSELPLWNPYQAAGTPLVAQYSTRAFFPYQILLDISPVGTWDFYFLGRLWIAGLFTFMFLRGLGVLWASALLGALCYMFSGTFVWFINLEQFVNVAMVTPALLWAVDGLWRWRWQLGVMAVAVCVGLVLLAGQPEAALFALLMSASYGGFRLASAPASGRPRRLIAGLGGALLGAMLAAPQLLPFLEFERTSYNIHPAGGPLGVQDPAKPWYALSVLIPNISQHETFYRVFPENGRWDWLGGYLGIVPIYVGALGLVLSLREKKSRWRNLLIFFATFGLLVVLKNFGSPLVSWIGYLPLLDRAWSPRWAGPVWTLAFAITAALGAEALRDKGNLTELHDNMILWFGARYQRARALLASWKVCRTPKFFFGSVLVSVLIIGTYAHLHLTEGKSYFLVSAVLGILVAVVILGACMLATIRRLNGNDVVPSLCGLALLELWFAIPWGYDPATQSLRVFPLLMGFAAIATLARRRYKRAIGVTVAAVGVFLAVDLTAQYGLPGRLIRQELPPYVSWLQHKPGYYRVAGINGILMPNYASAAELYDIRYINALTEGTYHKFRADYLHNYLLFPSKPSQLWFTGLPPLDINITGSASRIDADVGADIEANLSFYSLLGVKYFVAPRGYNFHASSLAGLSLPLLYDREVRIYENSDVTPRSFVAHRVEEARSYHDAQRKLGEPDLSQGRGVVLEQPLPVWYQRLVPTSRHIEEQPSVAAITSYRLNSVAIEAEAVQNGVLVLTDVYDPGWKASVDGRLAEVVRVDGLFRGVFVERGRHSVRFWYAPESFTIGFGALLGALSCIAILGLSTGVVTRWWRR